MMQSAIALIWVSDIRKAPVNYPLRPLSCRHNTLECHTAIGNPLCYFNALRGFGFVRRCNGKRQGKRKRGVLIVCKCLSDHVHFQAPILTVMPRRSR